MDEKKHRQIILGLTTRANYIKGNIASWVLREHNILCPLGSEVLDDKSNRRYGHLDAPTGPQPDARLRDRCVRQRRVWD